MTRFDAYDSDDAATVEPCLSEPRLLTNAEYEEAFNEAERLYRRPVIGYVAHIVRDYDKATRRHLSDTVLACRRCNSARGAPSVAAPEVCPLLAAVKREQ